MPEPFHAFDLSDCGDYITAGRRTIRE